MDIGSLSERDISDEGPELMRSLCMGRSMTWTVAIPGVCEEKKDKTIHAVRTETDCRACDGPMASKRVVPLLALLMLFSSGQWLLMILIHGTPPSNEMLMASLINTT